MTVTLTWWRSFFIEFTAWWQVETPMDTMQDRKDRDSYTEQCVCERGGGGQRGAQTDAPTSYLHFKGSSKFFFSDNTEWKSPSDKPASHSPVLASRLKQRGAEWRMIIGSSSSQCKGSSKATLQRCVSIGRGDDAPGGHSLGTFLTVYVFSDKALCLFFFQGGNRLLNIYK